MMRELQRQQRALAGIKLAVCGLALLSAIALSLVLMLTGSSELSLAARLVVGAVATAAFVAECVMGQRSVTELHPISLLCGPVVALATAEEESIRASVNAFVSRRVARRTTRMTSPARPMASCQTLVSRVEAAMGGT